MAETYDSSTGNIVSTTDAPGSAEKVSVFSPTGEQQEVSKKTARHLLAQGFQLDTPELRQQMADQVEFGDGFGNEAAAGALGLARGATFGLSDLALSKTGAMSPEELHKREELNPDASMAGEAASFLLPAAGAVKALGTAGKVARGLGAGVEAASAVGRGVEAAGMAGAKALGIEGTSLAGQVAGHMLPRAAGIAAEAELYQIGHNLSQSVMRDQELTAESLLAHSENALVAGGVLGLGGPLAWRAGRAMVDKAVPEIAKLAAKEAGNLVVKSAQGAVDKVVKFFDPDRSLQLFSGAMQKELKQETGGRFQKAVRELREEGFYRAGDIDVDIASGKLMQVAKGELPSQEGALARLSKIVEKTGDGIGGTLKHADEAAAAAGIIPDAARWGLQDSKAAMGRIDKWRASREITEGEARSLQSVVDDVASGVGEASGSLETLHQMRRGLDARIGGKNWEKLSGNEIELVKDLRRTISDKIKSSIDDLADRGLVQNKEQWSKLNKLYGNLKAIQAPLDRAIARSEANVNVGGLRWRDMLAGVGGSSVGGAVGGAAGAVAGAGLGVLNKLVQTDKGLLLRAKIGEELGALVGANGALQGVAQRISDGASAFVNQKALPAVGRAARLAEAPTAARAEMAFSDDRDHVKAMQAAKGRQERYHVAFDQLGKLVGNPMQTAERIGSVKGMEHVGSGVRDQLVLKQMQTYSYLYGTAPKDPLAEYQMNPTASKYSPSDGEIASWELRVRAASSPLSILDDLKKGDVTPEAAETVRTLYPKLYGRLQSSIMEQVGSTKKPMRYEDRVQLGILFDVPTDPSLQPQFLQSLQERFTQGDGPTDQGTSQTARASGAAKMDVSGGETRAQSLMASQ